MMAWNSLVWNANDTVLEMAQRAMSSVSGKVYTKKANNIDLMLFFFYILYIF